MTYEEYSEWRIKFGLNDAKICKMTGIAPATISDWKHGKSTPKEEKLRQIASALNLPYSTFIGEKVAPVQLKTYSPLEEMIIEKFRASEHQEAILALLGIKKSDIPSGLLKEA